MFISVSTLLVIGLGVWQLVRYFGGGPVMSLVWGLAGIGGALLLVIYGVAFWKKLKKISML